MDTDTRKLVNHPSSSLESPTPIWFYWTCSPCVTAKQTSYVFYNVLYQLQTFIPCSWPSLLVSDGPASHLLQVFQSWLVFCGQPIGHKCFQPAFSNLLLTYFDMWSLGVFGIFKDCQLMSIVSLEDLKKIISFNISRIDPLTFYAISSDFQRVYSMWIWRDPYQILWKEQAGQPQVFRCLPTSNWICSTHISSCISLQFVHELWRVGRTAWDLWNLEV